VSFRFQVPSFKLFGHKHETWNLELGTSRPGQFILAGMSLPAADGEFHTTHWSLVASAGLDGEAPRAALAELCQAYWYPLYAYLRRKGHQADDAADLTQGFFAALLEKGYLADADPERGRFRSFLLTAVTRFAAKEHEKARAQKRGGDKAKLPLDFAEGERRYQREPADHWTAERLFDRQWALALLEQTLAQMREEYDAAGKLALFEALKCTLTGESNAPRLLQVAQTLEMTEGAIKVAVHRLRQKYRERLRQKIAQTLGAETDIDDELATLLAALRGE